MVHPDGLRRSAAGSYRIFTETASGKLTERPELDRLLDQLRPGDTLAVWCLDRLDPPDPPGRPPLEAFLGALA